MHICPFLWTLKDIAVRVLDVMLHHFQELVDGKLKFLDTLLVHFRKKEYDMQL